MPLLQAVTEFAVIVDVGYAFFLGDILIRVVASLIVTVYFWARKMLHQSDFGIVGTNKTEEFAFGLATLGNILRGSHRVGQSPVDTRSSVTDVQIARQEVCFEKVAQCGRGLLAGIRCADADDGSKCGGVGIVVGREFENYDVGLQGAEALEIR